MNTFNFAMAITSNQYAAIGTYSFVGMDSIVSSLMVFLMQRHNQREYRIFLMGLYRLGILSCCQKSGFFANVDIMHENVRSLERTVTLGSSNTLASPSVGSSGKSSRETTVASSDAEG